MKKKINLQAPLPTGSFEAFQVIYKYLPNEREAIDSLRLKVSEAYIESRKANPNLIREGIVDTFNRTKEFPHEMLIEGAYVSDDMKKNYSKNWMAIKRHYIPTPPIWTRIKNWLFKSF